jgi:biopolymer transport protein ExbD
MRIAIGEEEPPEISLIALIDCIFFLLMFFMVASSFQKQAEGKAARQLPITLPQSAVSLDESVADASPVVLGLDVKGGVYWGRDPVTTVELRERLHAQAQRDPGRAVRIDGDTRVAYQEVVHLLDLCQFEGLTHVSLRARAGG